MNRGVQLAVLVVSAAVLAIGLYWWLWGGESAEMAELPTAIPQAGEGSVSQTPPPSPPQSAVSSGTAPSSDATDAAGSSAAAPQVVTRPTPDAAAEFLAPTFDVVRVEKSGEAVVAGRAEPRSEVTLYDNGVAIASTTADSNGEWVLIPEQPLAPGNHELGVTARAADGRSAQSSDVVIVFVPHPEAVAAAESPTAAPELPSAAPADAGSAPISGTGAAPAAPSTGQTVTAPAVPPAGQTATAPTAPEAGQGDAGKPAGAPTGLASIQPRDPSEPLVVVTPRDGGPARVLQQPEATDEGLVAGELALETIDYDREGRATVGGRAAPGNRVRIYLDNVLAGESQGDRQGRWGATLDVTIEPGLHQLRVDELNSEGKVVSRIEAPFSRAEVVAEMPRDRTVVVQWGNSLWRIARRTYGDGLQYHVIFQANREQIRDPDLIYPGQVFTLPSQN